MEVELKKLPDVVITLTSEEACLLMGLIQNYPGDPNDEPNNEYNFRKDLFESLQERLT